MHKTAHPPWRSRGFTILELAVALAIIGLMVGVVSIGQDLYRNAQYQRITGTFVQGWQLAYNTFESSTGTVPGDDPSAPTGQVNGDGTELCNGSSNTLLNLFLAAGVDLPAGRAEGLSDQYVYHDSNGNPQSLQVCFKNVQWAVPAASVGSYVKRPRNVMVIRNMTPSLARHIDASIDGQPDARFGQLREDSVADAPTTGQTPWSVDDRMAFGERNASARDETQVAVVTGYYLMNR